MRPSRLSEKGRIRIPESPKSRRRTRRRPDVVSAGRNRINKLPLLPPVESVTGATDVTQPALSSEWGGKGVASVMASEGIIAVANVPTMTERRQDRRSMRRAAWSWMSCMDSAPREGSEARAVGLSTHVRHDTSFGNDAKPIDHTDFGLFWPPGQRTLALKPGKPGSE